MSVLDRLRVPNHRGALVPRTLWIPPLVLGVATGVLGVVIVRSFAEPGPQAAPALVATLGCALVTAAGVVDDLLPQRARGLRGHLRALADGDMTTGVLKVIVIAGASVFVMALSGPRSVAGTLAGVVTLAGAANLWNGLDVAPGRAVKAYLLATALIVLAAAAASIRGWSEASVCVGVTVGAALVLLPDLRERGMLGDAGANLLGFAVGIALVTGATDAVLVALAAILVALNVVAETVTLSRAIDAIPPLRWLDRLGRLPDAPPTPSAG
jgi:UDP-N-acetylmuramyl pentapeptide phosphotransferase/UDP-N-acetylglucosamine-1-phosphate transferase